MNLRPLVVTGPIGSGKSTVSKLLEDFGAHRVDLDQLSREVLETDEGVRFVEDNWPSAISEATIDRAALARIVFTDQRQLRRLEEFVHPLVLAEFYRTIGPEPDLVVEMSVPFSISIANSFFAVIDTPDVTRVARLRERGMSAEDINARMQAQPPRPAWLEIANTVISNWSTEKKLARHIEALWLWWTETEL